MLKTRYFSRTRPRRCVRARVRGNVRCFDANGAMTKDGLRSYEFDAAHRWGSAIGLRLHLQINLVNSYFLE